MQEDRHLVEGPGRRPSSCRRQGRRRLGASLSAPAALGGLGSSDGLASAVYTALTAT